MLKIWSSCVCFCLKSLSRSSCNISSVTSAGLLALPPVPSTLSNLTALIEDVPTSPLLLLARVILRVLLIIVVLTEFEGSELLGAWSSTGAIQMLEESPKDHVSRPYRVVRLPLLASTF